MNIRGQFDIDGQEALRVCLLKELTNSDDHNFLLKEHYDWLQDLTSISKKTLKRFFKERVKVGAQTRNLLAAIALGRKDELNSVSNSQKDYYLLFLESLEPSNSFEALPPPVLDFTQELEEILSRKYAEEGFLNKIEEGSIFQSLMVIRKRVVSEQNRFILTESIRVQPQEMQLNSQLLYNHSRSVLVGDAGMGKTCFAKRICRTWAFQKNKEERVPIYIDLKSDRYNEGEHSLIDFLLIRYFDQQMDWAVTEFLEHKPESYYLILDGFDHLSMKRKHDLMEEVNAFSDQTGYVILSRPYGFNDFTYPDRSVFEIAGLNGVGRAEFLRDYTERHGIQVELPFLLNYLKNHPILSRLSRCPLSLIRIARLTRNKAFYELLDDVKSNLDLQHLINSFEGELSKN